MLSKNHDNFISLKREEHTEEAMKAESPQYPTLYLSGKELPLSDKDLEVEGIAEIKYKPRRISKEEVNGKKSYSYELEILAINIKP